MKQIFAPLVAHAAIADGVRHIQVKAPQITSEAQPGQFVTVRCGNDVLLRRPLSIHQIDGDTLGLLFAVVGQGTEWLANLVEGDVLDILGPIGNGFSVSRNSENLLLIAGGIGIAPLPFLAQRAVADERNIRMVIGAKTADHLFPITPEIPVKQVTEDGSAGKKGVITDFLPDIVDWADEVFACGPIPMYRSMIRQASIYRDKPVQILLEQVMACGIGACRGCAVPTRQGMKMVCQDGPVFDLRDIDWDQLAES